MPYRMASASSMISSPAPRPTIVAPRMRPLGRVTTFENPTAAPSTIARSSSLKLPRLGVARVGATPGRDEDLVPGDPPAVGAVHHFEARLARDALGREPRDDRDALVLEPLAHEPPHFGILARQHFGKPLQHRDGAAEAVIRLRQLEADRPPTEHDEPRGQRR